MSLLPSVTLESIRLWAYDPALTFHASQEASLLQHLEWVPLLLELSVDPACPKLAAIQRILGDFMQQAFLEREEETLETLQKILIQQNAELTSQWLILTLVTFNYIYKIFQQPQRITEAACDQIAKELLQGSRQESNFTKEAPLEDQTQVYAMALDSLKQYLYISPYTGEWKTSKYLRWKTFTDASTL